MNYIHHHSYQHTEETMLDDNKAVRLSLPLGWVIHNALEREAKQKKRELTEHIQRILAEHVIAQKLIEQEEAHRLQLLWSLVAQAVHEAKRICINGGFKSSITLDAINACLKNEKWVSGYREFVKDDIYKNGNPLKGVINREIGYRIRAGIGGKVATIHGKPAIAKVAGSIIQSYTPMEAYDSDLVAKDHS